MSRRWMIMIVSLCVSCGPGAGEEIASTDALGSTQGALLEGPGERRPMAFALLPTPTPTFTFASLAPAGRSITYRLQWDQDPTFSARTQATLGPAGSGVFVAYTVPAIAALAPGVSYYWRVQATIDGTWVGPWSSVRSLRFTQSVAEVAWRLGGALELGQGSSGDLVSAPGGLTLEYRSTPYWRNNFEDGTTQNFSVAAVSCSGCVYGTATAPPGDGTERVTPRGSTALRLTDLDIAGSAQVESTPLRFTSSAGKLRFLVLRTGGQGGESVVRLGSTLSAVDPLNVLLWGADRSFRYGTDITLGPAGVTSYVEDRWYEVVVSFGLGVGSFRVDVDGVPQHPPALLARPESPDFLGLSTGFAGELMGTSTTFFDEFEVYDEAQTGTYLSPPINYLDGPTARVSWGTVSWDETEPPPAATVRVQVVFWTQATGWAPIPATQLPGNTPNGFDRSPIDLTALDPNTFGRIRLRARLGRKFPGDAPPTFGVPTVTWASAGAPTHLAFLSAPQTVAAGQCSALLGVELEDASGSPQGRSTSLALALTGPPSMVFYADAACATTPITLLPIAAGASSGTFAFLDTTAGPRAIRVAGPPGFVPASQTETVAPLAPSRVVFITPPRQVSLGACSKAITVQLQDPLGNPAAPVGGPSAFSLLATPSPTLAFFSDPACTNVNATPSVAAPDTSFTFHVSDTAPGTSNLTVSSTTLALASQQVTIAQNGVANQIAFTTWPTSPRAGDCAGPFLLELQESGGGPATLGTIATFDLGVDDPHVKLYSGASCGQVIASVTIPAGLSTGVFYARAFTAPSVIVTASDSAGVLGSASRGVAFFPTAPGRFIFSSSPQTLAAGACSEALVLEHRDTYGNGVYATSSSTLALGSSSPTLGFFSDTACTTPITSTIFPGSVSKISVYFRDPTAGSPLLRADHVTGALGPARQAARVVPAAPAQLTFVTPPFTVSTGACAGLLLLEPHDAHGNLAAMPSDSLLSLASSSGTLRFFMDPLCASETSSVVLYEGKVAATFFYFSDTVAGTPSIDVSHPLLGTASQLQTITASVSADHIGLSAPATVAAGAPATISLQVLDLVGSIIGQDASVTLSASGNAVFSGSGTNTLAITTSGGIATAALQDTLAETVNVTVTRADDLSGIPLPVAAPHESASIDVVPAAAQTLVLSPPEQQAQACSAATLNLALADTHGNTFLPAAGAPVAVSFSVSGLGSAMITSTSLSTPDTLPAPSMTATLSSQAPAVVALVASESGVATLELSSADLPMPSGPARANVIFVPGPLSPGNSAFKTSATRVAAGGPPIDLVVIPVDACGARLGSGLLVEIVADHGAVGAVADMGDGSYQAPFTVADCSRAQVILSASVEAQALPKPLTLPVLCTIPEPDPPLQVGPEEEACASKGVFSTLTLTPQALNGTPLPPGATVGIVEDPPRLVQGSVTEQPGTGGASSTYVIEVGSNRCGTWPLTVEVNGVRLLSVPELTFGCPPVDAAAVDFMAAPGEVPADGRTPAVVTVRAQDSCGNPAFDRPAALETLQPGLPVEVVADALETDTEGVVVFRLTSQEAGATQVRATVDGVVAESRASPTPLVTFVVPENVLSLSYRTTSSEGVVGQVVRLEAVVQSAYPARLEGVVLKTRNSGLRILQVEGASREGEDELVLPPLPAEGRLELAIEAVLLPGHAQASSELRGRYGPGHSAGPVTITIAIRGDRMAPAGCSCESPGGERPAPPVFSLLFAALLFARRRRRGARLGIPGSFRGSAAGRRR